ncbi:putative holin-like toxin [Enterococcus hirae]
MPVETALGLMIGFGSLIATIIFGILAVVNNNQKKIILNWSPS